MGFAGGFRRFSKVHKLTAVLFGTTSSFVAWHQQHSSLLAKDIEKEVEKDNERHIEKEEKKADDTFKTWKDRDQTQRSTVNDKYFSLAPKLLSIIHQVKEVCGAPGISYAISHDGELVMKGGIGLADVENCVPCSDETVLRIASISKSLTSVAVAQLMEEGKVDLNESIHHYVPTFPLKKFNEEDVVITVRQAMSHTSGIRGYFDYEEKVKSKAPIDAKAIRKHEIEIKKYGKDCKDSNENYIMQHYASVEEGLDLFRDDALIYKPGTDYEYSSLAYSLISRMIETTSGKDYIAYMNRLCADLGLRATKVDLNDPIIAHRASNYQRVKGGTLKNVRYVDNSYKWSGGGFLSTVNDLVHLGNMLLYSSQSDQGFLKRSTVAALWTPEPITIGRCSKKYGGMGYGLGWMIKPAQHDQKHTVFHTGGAIGVSSVLLIVPDPKPRPSTEHAQGTVISLIVNIEGVSLSNTALEIKKRLDEHLESV